MFEVTLNPYQIKTWIRQEDGTIDIKEESSKKSLLETP